MQQINIRFNGQANFGDVEAELAALRKQFAALQAQAMKAAKSNDMVRPYERVTAQLADQRRMFLQNVAAMGDYDIRQTKTISQSESYAKRLQEQKVHLGEAIKQRKLFNEVLKDQISLQRAQAVSWTKGPDGRISADLIMPKDVGTNVDMARTRLGLFNNVLQSVADNTVKWGKNTQWAGRQLMVGFTVPMMIAAGATGKLAFEMDKSLTQITKVYGDANSAIQETTESIRESSMQTATNMASMYGQSAKDTLEITSQFAAAGKTGVELQQATAAATKARQLNEIDLQTAISASIAMQTVYGYSAEELGQKWDYINAVANQTVLGAEDFAVAIPKVAGVLKELGADIEDVGVLMTAFKAAGIDAAEGANALKTISFRAVSAYGKGLETFSAATGKDLKKIVDQTNGETIPTLLAMWDAMEKLSTPQRIAVVKDVFGIYQGNKALILMEQLASEGEQVAQALAVGKNSVAENANIANQELQRMNERPFKRIQKAVESVKVEMARMGEVVLPIVAGAIEMVSGLLAQFNAMPAGAKKLLLIAGGAIAIAGPITMLLGLFANLTGNVFKLFGVFGQLITRFKITNAEERAQVLIGKQATNMWDQRTAAVSRLTQELIKMNSVMAQQAMTQINPATAPRQLKSYQDMSGKPVYFNEKSNRWHQTEGGKMVKAADVEKASKVMGELERAEYGRAKASEAAAEATRAQAAAHKDLARNIGGTAAGAAMLTSMFVDADSVVGHVAKGVMGIGMAAALFPSVGVAITKGIVAPFRVAAAMAGSTETRIGRVWNATKGFAAGAAGLARAAALPFGAVAIALGALWYKANADADEHKKKIEDLGRTAETFGEILGFNYQQASGVMNSGKPSGVGETIRLAEAFKKANAEAASVFSTYQGREVGDKWGMAIAEGVRVRLHGGTVQAAEQATRVALELMGTRFEDDAKFKAELNVRVNFDDADDLIDGVMTNITNKMSAAQRDEGVGVEGFMRNVFGGGSITKASAELAGQAAKDAWQLFYNADASEREKIFNKIVEASNRDLKNLYERTAKAYPELMNSKGIKDYNDFIRKISTMNRGEQGGFITGLLGPSASSADVANVQQQVDFLKNFNNLLGEQMNVDEATRRGIYNTETYRGAVQGMMDVNDEQSKGIDKTKEYTAANNRFDAAVRAAEVGGKKLSDTEKLKLLNVERASMGLGKATTLTQGFTDVNLKAAEASMSLTDAMGKLQMATTEDQVKDTYRSTMEGSQTELIQSAEESLQREADLAAEALDNQMDRAMEGFEKRSEELDAAYDKREKAMDARHDRETKNLDKSLDNRKKSTEAYYDGRIKAVEKAIEVEKKAEDIRQKIFEAEKRRIERMAEMYNRNVDFNVALNSGNLDEAAKISNDMRAQTEAWMTDDAAEGAKGVSDVRVERLEKQKSAIDATKKMRLDALGEVEKAEKEALSARQKRETEALRLSRDGAKKRLDAEKDSERKKLENAKKTNAAVWRDRQRALQLELATIRAYIPRNEAELRAQAERIRVAYNKYGKNLKAQGDSWSKHIGTVLNRNVKNSGEALRSTVNWQSIGSDIANGLIKGGFGMTPGQFAKWLNGGQAPPGTLFSPKTKAGKPRYGDAGKSAGGGTSYKGGVLHSGGIVGNTRDYKRTGYSGNNLSQSEVMINALKGEAVLNRRATDVLGEENIAALNKGKLPANTGPWGHTGLGAAMAAGAAKAVMSTVLNAVVARKIAEQSGTEFGAMGVTGNGKYGGVNLSREQLNNAATIMGVGRSLGASQRDLVIALMTAMQESTLRNLNYGDRDSLGLFQQRAAWGPAADRTNPAASARMFFLGGAQGQRGLFDFPNRGQMGLAQAAQAVQVSAFPDAYAKWAAMAQSIAGGVNIESLSDYVGLGAGINMAQYGVGAGGGTGWAKPAAGRVTSEYGMRVNPVTGAYRLHAGTDIGAPGGAPIYASRGGKVISAGYSGGYGNYTVIDHGDGMRTAYAHQSAMSVKAGQLVAQGQRIGSVGTTGNSTGNHLHFEYIKNGARVNPRTIIPQLSEGGYTLNTGLANLHPKETVLTAPLTKDLHEGLGKFAKGDNSEYNMYMDFRGASFGEQVDIDRALEKAMQKRERRVGVKRRIT